VIGRTPSAVPLGSVLQRLALVGTGSLAPSRMTGSIVPGPDRGIVLEPGNDGGLVTSEASVKLVRAEGLEPSRALRPNGFSYPSTAFAAPAVLPGFGVWTIPSPCPGYVSGFQVLPV
jgi:hypothetical protein